MMRSLISLTILLAMLSLLVGCGRDDGNAASTPAPAAPEPVEETVTFNGKAAYDLVCAGCHEEGVDGAPKTGDREAWAGRSWLWEAVLFEHAKQGYMDMPAKGGDESLDDAIVEKAAEYMLTRTFPDVKPAD